MSLKKFVDKNISVIMTVLAFASLLIVWELVSRFTKAGLFLPPASLILEKFILSFKEPIGKYTSREIGRASCRERV